MADISKIRIESGLYDIKDTTARADIDTINNTTIPGVESGLQGQIDTINNTTIPGVESGLQGQIDTINNTTIPGVEAGLQGQIDTLNNTTIPAINTRITAVANQDQSVESLVCIGDSYGVMDGTTNWPNYMKQFLSLDNDHFYNNSYGGVGFAHPNDDKTFTTLVQECMSLSEDRRKAVTHVLCAGGYNDQWSSGADVRAGVSSFVTTAHNVFPNAKIYIAHVGWSTNNSQHEGTFKAYYDGTCLTKYGKYIVNSQNILRGDVISIDNVHPTSEGLQLIAMNLVNGLQTGSCYPSSEFKYLKDSNNNNLGVVHQENDIITFEMYDIEYGYNGTANGNEINWCTLAGDSMISGHNNCSFNVQCMFVNGNVGQYIMGEAIITINQRAVKIKPIALKSDGTNFFDFRSIRFNNYKINIPHKFI